MTVVPQDATKDVIYGLSTFIKENFEKVYMSPYSKSIYNQEVDWGFKPQGVIRISGHWNFKSHGEMHCLTHHPVEDSSLSIGVFEGDKFNITASFNAKPTWKSSKGDTIYTLFVDEEGAFVSELIVGKNNEASYRSPEDKQRSVHAKDILVGFE